MKFNVRMTLAVDEEANFLSADRRAHVDDVSDLFKDIFYDVDDVKVDSITVKED